MGISPSSFYGQLPDDYYMCLLCLPSGSKCFCVAGVIEGNEDAG